MIGAGGDTGRALSSAIESYGVKIVPAGENVVVISIADQRSQRRPVATSANITAAQYELRLELDFSISQNSKVITPLTTVVAERIYSVDSLNLSGSYEEQQMLLADMREDLAREILARLESWLKSTEQLNN